MEKAKILIVEDEVLVAKELESELRNLGYEVTSIVDKSENAIEKSKADKPDLILMDIRINSGMDGVDAAEEIQSQFGIPVVFTATCLDDDKMNRVKNIMPFGYILKPIQKRELKVRIEMALYTAIIDAKRERAEEKLRKSEEKYRELAQSSNSIILTFDQNFDFTFINKFTQDFFGFSEDELIGRSLFGTIIPEIESSGRDLRKKFKDVFDKPEAFSDNENENTRKNGERVWVAWRNKGIYDDCGNLSGILSTGYDITKRKQVEDKVLETNRQLELETIRASELAEAAEMSNQAKSEFLANMSHEIHTPMNGVLGFTDMLLDTTLDDTQQDYAKTIKRSGDSLLSLINDILDFSKIEAGQLDFEEIDFDPELIAYDVCEIIRPKIGLKPIEILCSIGDNLPSYVKGDPTRFKQVLTNLMGNAPKFTENGEIELSIDIEEETQEQIKFHAKIRDTGIGIPKDKLLSIFEAFKQADGSTTRKYGGTGLGLSISKKISVQMKGNVWAESNEKKGSTFHFTAWFYKTEEKKTKRHTPVSLTGKNILIVDDNQTNLKILSYNLKSIGMKTIELTMANEVIPLLENSLESEALIDLCIFDIQMPEISGYDLARQVRSSKLNFSTLPLIALSSLMGNEAKKCEEVGFTGFLSKPVRKEKLYQMLERVLSDQKQDVEEYKIKTQYSIREEVKHGLHILLAEDNPTNQKLAKLMLTKAGYNIELANNGREAVEKFVAAPNSFDLIFMDIQMPELDGKEATAKIRKKGFNTIPIIAMTAHAMKGDRESCLDAGMNDYITKPINRKAVFDILEKWILKKIVK
ncbi:MAG: response regulator [Deltaproteobacteria bacterium]|jgi:two-component system, sensor histidine kinase and response regulator|nr:response regulator [Deltaproteobacteria bacterium]